MEDDWKEVKKKSIVIKNSNNDKNNFSQNGSYGWKNNSELKNSRGGHNNDFQRPAPPSFATNNNSTQKGVRGGYNNRGRGGGEYKPRRQQVAIPDFKDPEEEEKFTELKRNIPHLKMPGDMRRLAASIRIDGLAEKMLSDEWVEFQREGWEYNKVITPDKEDDIPEGDDYDLLSIENKWGDFVLFKKINK